MKRNSLFTKIAALMLCVMMVIGCLPMSAFALDSEGEPDIFYDANNPGELNVGIGYPEANEIPVLAGASDTYYAWTAVADGTFALEMPYADWEYTLSYSRVIDGKVTVVDSISSSTAEYPITEPQIDVLKDDVVTLQINSSDVAGEAYAAKLNVKATFNYVLGTEYNPEMLNAENTLKYHLWLDAGSYYIQTKMFGSVMTVTGATGFTVNDVADSDGVVTLDVVANGHPMWAMPNVYCINAPEGGDFVVTFTFPAGDYNNPAYLMMGKNSATVAENSQGYYYNWTAPQNGTLTIEMEGTGWSYVINNLTTGKSGDNIDYTDPVNPAVVEVAAGEQYQIIVGTWDAENWAYPAGTVVLNASFTAAFETAVAKIGDVEYGSVAEALNAAKANETVTMIANSDESKSTLIIKPNVTLDLATYELKAEYVIGLSGSYIQGIAGTTSGGLLKIGRKNINVVSDAKITGKGNGTAMIPVWSEKDAGYRFSLAQINSPKETKDTDAGTMVLRYAPNFTTAYKNLFKTNGGLMYGVYSTVTVSFVRKDLGMEVEHVYKYTDDMFKSVCNAGTMTASMVNCNNYTGLKMSINIVTETGIAITTGVYEY